jgi:hypothetical protein
MPIPTHMGGGGASKFNKRVCQTGQRDVPSFVSAKTETKKPEVSSKLEVTCDKAAGKVCVPSAIASGNGFVERAEFPHGHGSRNW